MQKTSYQEDKTAKKLAEFVHTKTPHHTRVIFDNSSTSCYGYALLNLERSMDHVKVGRVGPFPRVSKPVFLTSVILITLFIILVHSLTNKQK